MNQEPHVSCPFCTMEIPEEFIQQSITRSQQRRRQMRWNPGLASALNAVVPGLGYAYKGFVFTGISIFFLFGIMGLLTVTAASQVHAVAGLLAFGLFFVLWVVMIYDAGQGDPYQ